MPTYILQKKLPDANIGTEFHLDELGCYYHTFGRSGVFSKEIVENNIEWFKLKERKIEWSEMYLFIKGKSFQIEKDVAEYIKSILDKKRYTEEDMRKCFGAGFELSKDYSKTPTPFEDYINSLNKIHGSSK